MSRIAYVNGRYLPHASAGIAIDDRAFLFGDGVYEVCEVFAGRLVDETRHLDRLARSLSELRMEWPLARAALRIVMREVVARNRVRDGMVYLQVTRGAARRDHVFPPEGTPAGLVVTARSIDRAAGNRTAAAGIAVMTVPENRWDRVDVKSVNLLPNVLARQAAREAGSREAWFVDAEGFVTEGAATNAWIVSAAGRLVTRQAERGILRGVTRTTILDVAREDGIPVEERAFRVEEALAAREAFLTAATTLVMPVVRVDGSPIGTGKPGAVTLRLRERLHAVAELA